MFQEMVGLLRLAEAEFANRHVEVYIGWPMSSWMDRFAVGVMVFNMIRLPRHVPRFRIYHSLFDQRLIASGDG